VDLATWHDVLATEPATANQRGALMHEFERLGFHSRYDRAERLRVIAALTGADQVTSTADLTMGQAGALIDALQGCATRRGLRHLAGVEHRADLLEARPQTLADLGTILSRWLHDQLAGTARS
jgi:hypothetical protein